jgi:hypothetical protein
MWGQDNEQFLWFFQNFKKVGFLKIQISKIFWMTLKWKNLRKLIFRHIKLKLLTKASISCLSHTFYVNYNLIYECFRNYVFAKNYAFLHFHRDISEKLQHIKLWKFAVFHNPRGTSSLPSMNKIRDGRVFSLVHLTWNDP